jgi:hypothetical protein
VKLPRRRLPWLLAAFAAAAGASTRAAPTAPEVQLKAAFIYHFTQFVSWPAQAAAEPESPFVIGVFGDEALEKALNGMVAGEALGHHPLAVRHLWRPSDAATCQIVYVANDEEGLFRKAQLRADPVLTVGESESFLESGGMIEFFTDQNHVKLRINLPAARAASLQISAKLLRVAQVYSPP